MAFLWKAAHINQAKRLLSLLLLLANNACHGFLYIGNETYPSLPALFGQYMVDGKLYQARLQYFHDNPSLCEMDEKTRKHFVAPHAVVVASSAGSNLTTTTTLVPVLPVAILVSRGTCQFQQKAVVAESLHPSIEFLIVYNYKTSDNDESNEDTLVPMYSERFSRLVLLSVTHRTGQFLKQFIAEQDPDVLSFGGPIVRLDSQPPMGFGPSANVESVILSAMGLFFMLLSFAGCMVILAGTIAQLSNTNGNLPLTRRTVLTMAEIERLDQATSGECAICLDTIDNENSSGNALPCGHVYHKECLVPWLTERQAKCPLCKMDLLEHYEQQQQQQRLQSEPGTHRRCCLRLPSYAQVDQQEVELSPARSVS